MGVKPNEKPKAATRTMSWLTTGFPSFRPVWWKVEDGNWMDGEWKMDGKQGSAGLEH
jgi:hypothetical protein